MKCYYCDFEYANSDLSTVYDVNCTYSACPNCVAEKTLKCMHCNANIALPAVRYTKNDVRVCNTCLQRITPIPCDQCGEMRLPGDMFDVVNREGETLHYCLRCSEVCAGFCECCGGRFLDSALRDTVSGRHVCIPCISSNYTYCDFCGNYEHTDCICRAGSGFEACPPCYSHLIRCDECNERYAPGNITHISHSGMNRYVCDGCIEDGYSNCRICNRLFPEADLDENYHCENCAEATSDNIIHDYGYTPHLQFTKAPGEKEPAYYLGVELEAGQLYSQGAALVAAEELQEAVPLIYCKYDGSIPSYGFESVSHPCTLAMHKDIWEKALRILRHNDLDAREGCGLHVHISRSALSSDKFGFMDWFISKYQGNWEKISRRRYNDYAMYKPTTDKPDKDIHGKRYMGRYDAVNFQNSNTVEIRIFKATLDDVEMIGTLEIVDALINWCKVSKWDMITTPKSDAFKLFMAYVQRHVDKYPIANEYLKNLKLIK